MKLKELRKESPKIKLQSKNTEDETNKEDNIEFFFYRQRRVNILILDM